MDKTVLITGGAKNIGAAIAKKLYDNGYQTIIADIVAQKDSEILDSCSDYFEVDFSNINSANDFFSDIKKNYQILNLVNNVGVVQPSSIDHFEKDSFHSLMEINFITAVRSLQCCLAHMKKAEFGRVVSVVSRVTLGKINRTAYSASKGALLSASRTWALELGQYGITVNCISPGPIGTSEFWHNNPIEDSQTQEIINKIPVKRIGHADDVAHAAQFFLAKNSGFITGQNLYVCGGITTGLMSN